MESKDLYGSNSSDCVKLMESHKSSSYEIAHNSAISIAKQNPNKKVFILKSVEMLIDQEVVTKLHIQKYPKSKWDWLNWRRPAPIDIDCSELPPDYYSGAF